MHLIVFALTLSVQPCVLISAEVRVGLQNTFVLGLWPVQKHVYEVKGTILHNTII